MKMYLDDGIRGVWKRPLSEMVVGLTEITSENSFSIYPNPTNGQFTVFLPTENAEIIVTDILGQEIIKIQTTQNTSNLQINNNGIYNIYVQTAQGTATQKLIVNR
jgi:altronate dehydratase